MEEKEIADRVALKNYVELEEGETLIGKTMFSFRWSSSFPLVALQVFV